MVHLGREPLEPDDGVLDAAGSLIGVEHVSKTFGEGTSRSTAALEDVSFDVREGTIVSILGPSGCGKSTLLRVIGGLVKATHGTVTIDGREVVKAGGGGVYVFQEYSRSLFPWKTVAQNVAFPLRNASTRRSGPEIDETVSRYLNLVNLTGFEQHYPWQLSGGMQQRVALARALAVGARVLLLDEPFSSVDALTRAELQDLLLELWRQTPLTVLLVTHDIEEAIYVADRVLVMSRAPGQIVADIPIRLPRPRDHIATKDLGEYASYRSTLLNKVYRRDK